MPAEPCASTLPLVFENVSVHRAHRVRELMGRGHAAAGAQGTLAPERLRSPRAEPSPRPAARPRVLAPAPPSTSTASPCVREDSRQLPALRLESEDTLLVCNSDVPAYTRASWGSCASALPAQWGSPAPKPYPGVNRHHRMSGAIHRAVCFGLSSRGPSWHWSTSAFQGESPPSDRGPGHCRVHLAGVARGTSVSEFIREVGPHVLLCVLCT